MAEIILNPSEARELLVDSDVTEAQTTPEAIQITQVIGSAVVHWSAKRIADRLTAAMIATDDGNPRR